MKESHIFESILQIMLSYAKFGEIKYGDEPLSDERIQAVFGLITDIDSAIMSRSGKDRLECRQYGTGKVLGLYRIIL